jgi:subtilisin family serine protease
MYLDHLTGRGVRVAVIDSGVHAGHPHVNGVAGGFSIDADGAFGDDYVDRIGHGTAVIAAIREKAPDASILAIKVFTDSLATDVATLVRAIDAAWAAGADIVNLSLGTADPGHADTLRAAVDRANTHRGLIVSAVEDGGIRRLPGSLAGTIGVQLDWSCPRDEYRIVRVGNVRTVAASGYPRDIPGVPRERNLRGVSFGVANATAFVARAREALPDGGVAQVLDALERAQAGSIP